MCDMRIAYIVELPIIGHFEYTLNFELKFRTIEMLRTFNDKTKEEGRGSPILAFLFFLFL